MILEQVSWADMTSLNTMPKVQLEVSAHQTATDRDKQVAIRLHNPSEHIAFFERASVSRAKNGDEILPIQYDDNYITVYPGETAEIRSTVSKTGDAHWIELEGYNTPATWAHIQ